MQFDSLTYLGFLGIVFLVYWRLNRVSQNLLLLGASYLFYGWWDWRFLGLIIVSSVVDFLAAARIAECHSRTAKRTFLLLSIGTNLGILGVFKYFNFFATSLARMLDAIGFSQDPFLLNVILPVGISFYTFQTMSYTIDVYREKMDATRDPIGFFAYVAFFPQLVAGPIERAIRLLPQFETKRTFDTELAHDGLRQLLFGLFLKVVLANNLAPQVAAVYSLSSATGWSYWLATYLFAFQIYGDFAGYSHIAIGSAKLLGFSLCRNFAYPYFATSIADFWSRWHISLSTWFRDYVYIPLGGNRVGLIRHRRNVLITFVVSGLWHGAAWNFVVWGLLHGACVAFYNKKTRNVSSDAASRLRRFIVPHWREIMAMTLTFHVVCLGWVFFRASSVQQAFSICKAMLWNVWVEEGCLGHFKVTFLSPPALKSLCLIGAIIILEWCMRHREHPLQLKTFRPVVSWLIAYLFALIILLLGHVGEIPFIYFQF